MGKNVKGFELGERCVADVGVTVSMGVKPGPQPKKNITPRSSAKNAFIADGVNPFYARISIHVESRWMVVLQNTSSSQLSPAMHGDKSNLKHLSVPRKNFTRSRT